MALKAILSETEHVIAIEQDLGGDTVVVTFNPMWQIRNGLQFWADELLLKQGISAMGIVTLGPNWYPRQAMDELLATVRDRTNGRKVVTYGHGQGGYGALKFAARLRASATLSFFPQWSIDPADVAPFDTRFTRYFDATLGNGLRVEQRDLSDCSFIFFDKMDKLDAKNAAHLMALPGVRAVVTPFSMDETIRILTDGRGTATLIGLCASATPPEALNFRHLIRASRKGSSIYIDQLLRHCILRMSRSRAHSSVFVSRLLGRTKRDNLFYSALVAHMKGDAILAQLELEKTGPRAFDNINLVSWLHVSHDVGFVKAELTVAAQILDRHANNTAACLQALNAFVATGDLERVHQELERLAKHADAPNRIARFIEFSVKLRKPDILEHFLSGALPRSTRALILFSLVDLYQELGDRPNGFRTLKDLATTCADSPVDLRRVADYCVRLREIAFALEIRERLLRNAPRDYLLALDVVAARIPSDRHRARSDLKTIMGASDLPPACWERASYLYERLDEAGAALRAIAKAVAFRTSGPGVRHRLAVLLARKGQTRRARAELTTLLAEGRADPSRLRASGELAFNLGDRQLAQRFAEAQFQLAPTDPVSVLYLARQLRIVGDRNGAELLLSALFVAERRSPSLSGQQWAKLAQELYAIGEITRAIEAVAEAMAREPDGAVARKLADRIAMVERRANM